MMIRQGLFTLAASAVAFGILACQAETAGPTEVDDSGYSSVLYDDKTYKGKATASIEERAFAAEVVVKARFVSATGDVLTFRSIQYMKGAGPTRFTVRAETDGRDTQWDVQDAMLFLDTLSGHEDFEFTDTTTWDYWPETINGQHSTSYTGDLPEGYTLGTRNPVWLPVGDSATDGNSQSRGSSGSSLGGGAILTGYDLSGTPTTISESNLAETITWLGGSSAGASRSSSGGSASSDSSLYDRCILSSLHVIRLRRDIEVHSGEVKPVTATFDRQIESGIGKGASLVHFPYMADGSDNPGEYGLFPVFGRDARLFKSIISDRHNIPSVYSVDVITRRPLPAGDYQFKLTRQTFELRACDYQPNVFVVYDVEAIAPERSVHEAFFDPVTTTAGVGYLAGSATTTGVLEPAAFSVRGRAIAITGLTWQNGRVVLTLDRFGSWLDGFSFIEPDGSFGLVLSGSEATADRAAGTLTWAVPERPWTAGDQLMLRIAPVPLPPVGNLTAEVNSDGLVVLSWEVPYTAGVSGYRIWHTRPSGTTRRGFT